MRRMFSGSLNGAKAMLHLPKAETVYIVLLFVLVSITSFGFLNSPGTPDVRAFLKWMQAVQTYGYIGGYTRLNQDYPPLTSVILLGISTISPIIHQDGFTSFKVTLYILLLTSSLIFWLWTQDLFLASIFQLTLIINSMMMGYVDIFYTPTLLLGFWALQKRRLFLFTLLYAISCLIKWQPLIIAPIILIYIANINSLRDWRRIRVKELWWTVVWPALMIQLLLLSIYGFAPYKALWKALNDPFLSGNALNVNWMLTHYLRVQGIDGGLEGGLATHLRHVDWRIVAMPKLLFIMTYLTSCYMFLKSQKSFQNLLFYALLAFLSYFMLNTGVHENHLYIAMILAAVLYAFDSSQSALFATLALMANANLLFFYGINFSRVAFIDIALALSILNLVFYISLFLFAVCRTPLMRLESGAEDSSREPQN